MFYYYQREAPLGRGIQLSEQMEPQPGHGLPQEPVGPAFSQLPPVLTAALSPCPSPTLQVIHPSSPCPHQLPMLPSGWGSPLSPHPCPHLAEAGGSCICSPGQLLEQSPEGWPCVCSPGMTELAAVGGPGPHCPHGNLPKKQQLHHLPTRGPPP